MEKSLFNPQLDTPASGAAAPSASAPSLSTPVTPSDDSASTIAAILKVLHDGQRFLVCSHSRPDGDAVGSVLAMGQPASSNWANALTWSPLTAFPPSIEPCPAPLTSAMPSASMVLTTP